MAGNPDLFDDPQASEGDDVGAPSGFFAQVAEAGERRGIGRPKGARNKKSEAFERWYYAKGFKDPAQVLGEIASMDPLALHMLLLEHAVAQGSKEKPSLQAAIDIITSAAGELMPYLHGKKPVSLEVGVRALPILGVMNGTDQLSEAGKIIEGRQVLTAPIVVNEINDLAEGDK